MYIPNYSEIRERKEIFDIIRRNSFGLLVTHSAESMKAVHIPMILDDESEVPQFLAGHVSAMNDIFRNCSTEVLAVFSGPHCYVSPSWYESMRAVPTWNYVSVHVYGDLEIIEDHVHKAETAKRLVRYYESEDSQYSVDELPSEYFNGLVKGTIAFRLRIREIRGKKKLSQNHSAERQKRIISRLLDSTDESAREVARLMQENLNSIDDGEGK